MTAVGGADWGHILAERAVEAERTGRLADARRYYEFILCLQPDYLPLFFPLSQICLAMGRREDARHLLRRAVGVNGGFPSARLLGGVVEAMCGAVDEAGVLFETAMADVGKPWNLQDFRTPLADWSRFIDAMRQGYFGAVEHMGRAAPAVYGAQTVDAACPVCGSRPVTGLFSVTARQAAAHFCRSSFNAPAFHELSRHITALWGGEDCTIARCGVCGFGFAHPYVAGDAHFYEVTFDEAIYPDDKWEFEATRTALQARRDAGTPVETLLEAGAGKGAFITSLVPGLMRAENIAFTEYNTAWQDTLTGRGFTALPPDTISQPPTSLHGRFDAVCAFQVIEHCARLDEIFAGFATLVRPGGSLFVAMPGTPMTELAERSGGVIDMPPNHIGRWTPAALDIMGRRHGWTVVECRLDPKETPADRLRFLQSSLFMREIQIPGSLAQAISVCPDTGLRESLIQMLASWYRYRLQGTAPHLASPVFSSTLWAHLVRDQG